MPTYVIVNPQNGEVIKQLVGYTDKDKFENFLDEGLNRFNNRQKTGTQVGLN